MKFVLDSLSEPINPCVPSNKLYNFSNLRKTNVKLIAKPSVKYKMCFLYRKYV